MTDNSDKDTSSTLVRFFSRPEVGIIGSLASVIGIILSIYFFLASREKPELTYFVHPAKAAVVRTGQSSRLSVKYDRKVLASDITAAQIAFWNAGSKPIRANEVLSPLVIRTGNKCRILEAKLRKASRDVSQIILDSSNMASGEVAIRWNILEQNDGGVIQIIYAGDETVDINAKAIVEAQSDIVELKYRRELLSPNEQYARSRERQAQMPAYVMLVIGAIMLLAQLFINSQRRQQRIKLRLTDWLDLFQGPVMIAFALWLLLTNRQPGPPFGF